MTINEAKYKERRIGKKAQGHNDFHFTGYFWVFHSLKRLSLPKRHTSAKLIEIQLKCLSKIHGLHELGSCMECNDNLHGSELGPHWVLGPKYSKFGPMGPKIFAQKFLYTK